MTLALNPRARGDVGWQLSFAAVVGILLWAGPTRRSLLDARRRPGARRARAVAEGAAVTVAATLATAPLMAHHFESLSLASLPANLLALPAVAPAMWLGMLAAAVGQVPGIPVEPLNWLNSACSRLHRAGRPLARLAGVGAAGAGPRRAAPGRRRVLGLTALIEASLGAASGGADWASTLVRGTAAGRTAPALDSAIRSAAAVAVAALVPLALLATPALVRRSRTARVGRNRCVVRVLDVGQGDAILLDPPAARPCSSTPARPARAIAGRLRDLGVRALAAVVVTHDQSRPRRRASARCSSASRSSACYWRAPAGELLGARRRGGRAPGAHGRGLRGALGRAPARACCGRRASWSSRCAVDPASGVDPNGLSLVLLAEWRDFSMLLTGDAEAEAVPLDPGPVDVLKVAHHGSDDAGLDALLDRTAPRLAVISVGEDNPYGHPDPETLDELDSSPAQHPAHRPPRRGRDGGGSVGWTARSTLDP